MTEPDLEVMCLDCGAKVLIDAQNHDLTPVCPMCDGVMRAEASA